MNIIDKVLSRDEFKIEPPVLVDIGASSNIHPKWKSIAKYCICIAFDADKREMNYVLQESSEYQKLYVYNSIITNNNQTRSDFYLTKSPHCSSLLKPNTQKLKDFAFADLFEIQNKVTLKSSNLTTILKELKLDRVDWFKTDSQGTDLRLFISLGEDIINKVLVAEFEPGIIDSYEGEDKLHSLMSYMENHDFWMSDIKIQGCQRINQKIIDKYLNKIEQKFLDAFIKISPGWTEVTYINSCSLSFSKRNILLSWVFSMLEKQYGFALELAIKGNNTFQETFFDELISHTLKQIKKAYYYKLPKLILKRKKQQFLSILCK